ncbi:MAG: discoidin domain-containing protein [Pirellulales bacterium]
MPNALHLPRLAAVRFVAHAALWLGFAASTAITATSRAADQPPPKPLKALLICGGCCHDYDAQKQLIAQGLQERAHVEVTVIHQGGSATNSRIPFYENPNWADGYDVVLHDECFADVKDTAWTDRVLKPHRGGKPAVVVHCAMHCYRDGTDEWFKFLGVTSRTHGQHYPHEVLNVDGLHPIMKTFGPAWFNPAGELYWIEKLWPTAKPLAVAKNRENGKSETCVWTNQYGDARVFGTTLGHHNETVSSGPFLDLLTRGTLWACGKLDDAYLKPVQARRVPINLAKGQAAQATSEETGKNNFAKNAVDGNPATRWCAAGGGVPEALTVDLGKSQTLTGCRIDWEGRDAAYQYRVEGSDDGRSWQLLVDGSKNETPGPSQREFQADARYLRVTYLGCNRNLWGSIWELQVFGEGTTIEQAVDSRREKEVELMPEVKTPEGFQATLFAAPPAVTYPVFVAAAPDGTVFVSSDGNGSLGRDPRRGRVLRLKDHDGDGRADEVKMFVPDVDSPRGLVWDHDRIYLLHPPHLSAFIDHDGDGVSDEQQILVKNVAFDLKARPADHTSNGVTLGIDGWLYLAIGDFGFMEAEGTDGQKVQLRGGGVVRVRPDGTGLEVYSRGTRNILEVAVDPRLNGFARDNTNDGGGWDIRLHHFTGMEQHGYPSLFRNFPEDARTPLDIYGGGSGCGGLYLSEPGFPEGYGDALYTADWGRQWVYRHRLAPHGASMKADQSEFVSVTRVTDLDVDASSRLYVASWKGATFNYAGEDVGYLVEVRPAGYTAPPLVDVDKATAAQLVQELSSPSHRRRLHAQRALVRRKLAAEVAGELLQLTLDRRQPTPHRIAALMTLRLASLKLPLAGIAVDDEMREYQLRALSDGPEPARDVPLELLVESTRAASPRVRRQAAESIARLNSRAAAASVLPLLVDSDPIVAHSALYALLELQADEVYLATLESTDEPAAVKLATLRVLGQIHQPRVVDALIARLATEPDAALRKATIAALCRLSQIEGTWKGDSWGTRPDTTGPYYQPESWDATERIVAALRGTLEKADGDEASHLVREVSRHRVPLKQLASLLVALAKKQPDVVPALVEQIAREGQTPPDAASLLAPIAAAPESAAGLRSQAVVGLARLNSPNILAATLKALDVLYAQGKPAPEYPVALQAVLSGPHLFQHVERLRDWSQGDDATLALWADAALVGVVLGTASTPEARLAAQQALEAGNDQPARRKRLIEAVRVSQQKGFKAQVLEGLQDKDPTVVAAARQTADELKLLVRSNVKPAGPKLADIPVADAIAQATNAQGDPALGEELFGRLGCAKCHTISPAEPPRGPYLGTIANTYKRRELAESILVPSKSLAQGFVTQVFALEDGRTVTGFVVQEGAERVLIRTADAKEIAIPVDSIEERVKQTISMMPEGLVRELTIPELASLLDYLEALPKRKN